MNKVDSHVAIPNFSEHFASKPRQENGFFNRLNAGSESLVASAAQPDELAAPASERHDLWNSELLCGHLTQEKNALAMSEVYGFSQHALCKLSYLSVAIPEAMPGPVNANEAINATYLGGFAVGHEPVDAAAVVENTSNQNLSRLLSTVMSSDGGAQEEVADSVLSARFFASLSPVQEKIARKIQMFLVPEGVEAVVRDYNLPDASAVSERLLQHCQENGIVLSRILLNGNVVWSSHA